MLDLDAPVAAAEEVDRQNEIDEEAEKFDHDGAQPVRQDILQAPGKGSQVQCPVRWMGSTRRPQVRQLRSKP